MTEMVFVHVVLVFVTDAAAGHLAPPQCQNQNHSYFWAFFLKNPAVKNGDYSFFEIFLPLFGLKKIYYFFYNSDRKSGNAFLFIAMKTSAAARRLVPAALGSSILCKYITSRFALHFGFKELNKKYRHG